MNSDDRCFCDLAPLYALDLVDAPERHWVEQQIEACADLAAELADFETAIAAIPYSAEVDVPMAANLKQRLFERIGQPLPPAQPNPVQPIPPPSYTAIRSSELNWRPYRIPGVMVARLHFDHSRREVVGLLKADAGVRYPTHCHATGEEIYMLEGDLIIGENIYGPGDYIRSAQGSTHAPETRGGCMFFVRTSVDDEYPEN